MKYHEIRKTIRDLELARPDCVHKAKKRAEANRFKVNCPICNSNMSILHIFLQLTPHEDPMIDNDWHIKYDNCNHEDYITIVREDTSDANIR